MNDKKTEITLKCFNFLVFKIESIHFKNDYKQF